MYNNADGTNPYIVTGTTAFTQTGPATFSSTFNANALSLSNSDGVVSIATTYGGNASATPNSVIIDHNIYAATEGTGGATVEDSPGGAQSGTQTLYLLSSSAAPPPGSLLAGGTLCTTCAYSQWGYWGGSVVSPFGGGTRTDIGHLNFWVAGQPTVTIPTSGTGTYAGSMIGAVNSNGSGYVATGNFNLSYTFGLSGGTGTFTSTFDGNALPAVAVSGTTATGAPYTGTFGTVSITETIAGKFFGPNATTPPETGGAFAYQNTAIGYQAAGVFQGHH